MGYIVIRGGYYMFLKSFWSLARHSVAPRTSHKYKVRLIDFNNNSDSADVICDLVDKDQSVRLDMKDIIANKLHLFDSRDVFTLSKTYINHQNETVNLQDNTKKYYNSITIAFTMLLLLSNVAETKICNFFGFALGAGTIIFPLLYILSDILTEVYGFTASRKAIFIGFFYSCFFSVFIYIVCLLPAFEYWGEQDAFERVFRVSPRIIMGSVISYFIGELLNTTIIALLKIKYHGRYFSLRAIFSTFIGSLVESIIFGCIAFFGRLPLNELIGMIVMLTLIKVTYELLAMPITIKLVNYLKKVEELEVFEKPSFSGFLPKFLKIRIEKRRRVTH